MSLFRCAILLAIMALVWKYWVKIDGCISSSLNWKRFSIFRNPSSKVVVGHRKVNSLVPDVGHRRRRGRRFRRGRGTPCPTRDCPSADGRRTDGDGRKDASRVSGFSVRCFEVAGCHRADAGPGVALADAATHNNPGKALSFC